MIKKITLGIISLIIILMTYLHFALLFRINNETQAQTEALKIIIKQNNYTIHQNDAIIKKISGKWI